MKRRKNTEAFSIKHSVLGCGISVAGYLLLTAVAASMVLNQRISIEASGWAVRCAAVAGALLGSLVAVKINSTNPLITCVIVAAVSLLVEFSLSLLVLDGAIQKPILLGVAVCLGSAAGGSLGGVRRKSRKHRKRSR